MATIEYDIDPSDEEVTPPEDGFLDVDVEPGSDPELKAQPPVDPELEAQPRAEPDGEARLRVDPELEAQLRVEPGGEAEPLAAGAAVMADVAADQRGWGPGWPADRRGDMARVTSHGVTVLVHRLLAPLIGQLLDETQGRGYQLRPDECWGYANRAIRGTNRPSNHSWGLAVDLNSRTNPMGSRLVTDMPPWMTQLWKSRGFRWGGDYRGRKDAMHYEFMGTPADVGGTVDPGPSRPDDEFRRKVMAKPVLRRGSKGQDVRILQGLMIAHAAFKDTGGHVDGDFGPATERALRQWQARTGRLKADGICGPQTWAWLVGV